MEDLIVVTGYGQFAGHDINASEEAVKLLPQEIKVQDKKFKIKTIFVSVEYGEVDKKVEEIWKLRPYLVVHCGVHGTADNIKLEKCAYNNFCLKDFKGNLLPEPVVCLEKSGKCRGLETKLNVDKITKTLNETHAPMFEASCDVGRYLCGYIYLKSLDIDRERSIFVHVPCIDKPYSVKETSDAILKIVEACVKDLNNSL